jgi:hypothetical protein
MIILEIVIQNGGNVASLFSVTVGFTKNHPKILG